MKKNKKWNNKLRRYEYLASADEVAQVKAKYDADQAAALIDPRPTSVSLLHFVERNMGLQIAAGECVVTMPKPCSGEPIAIVEVHAPESKRDCFHIIDLDGKTWTYFSATLTVEWTNRPVKTNTIENTNRDNNMHNSIQCTSCQTPLRGEVDTFGSIDAPMCWNCHSALIFDTPSEPLEITASIFAADADDPTPVWVNGSEVEPVIDSFTCDHCGRIVETWCGKCYCCTMHCTCGKADGNTPVTPNGQPPSRDGGNAIDMENILNVIAAVAADNLMTTEIVPTGELGVMKVCIVDGLGNALSEPVEAFGMWGASAVAGRWWQQYRYGEHLIVHNGSGGTGLTDPIGRFERRMFNAECPRQK